MCATAVAGLVGPGSYVGELTPLIDAGPRSATVTATTPMRVLVIGTREFSTLLDEVPGLARRVLVSTARRLRRQRGAHQPIH